MNLNHPALTLKIGQNGLETYWGMGLMKDILDDPFLKV